MKSWIVLKTRIDKKTKQSAELNDFNSEFVFSMIMFGVISW